MKNQRLEFNPTTEGYQWHIETEGSNAHEDNTFGWRTIAQNQDYMKLSVFLNFIESTHKRKLKLNQVKDLWQAFSAGYEYIKPSLKQKISWAGIFDEQGQRIRE